MKPHRLGAILLAATLLIPAANAAAQKRDPLSPKEIDEMRESADWPDKRLEVMVKLARTRMSAIEELEANAAKAKDRPMQIHDLLEDFTFLLDELEDNLDMYGSHKADMRKGLVLLIEANGEWQLKLRRLKEKSPPEELDQYAFVLTNATEAVNEMGEDARKSLQQQNEWARDKKLTKVYTERKD